MPINDPGLSMGVLGSDDNTYRVPIIDLREVAFASAPLKAGNTSITALKVVGLIEGVTVYTSVQVWYPGTVPRRCCKSCKFR